MEEVSVRRCKHGLSENVCSLCLGYPQTGAPLVAGGVPSWWISSAQFSSRTKYAGEAWKGGPAALESDSHLEGRGKRKDTKSRRRRFTRPY